MVTAQAGEQRYRRLFENLPICIFIVDLTVASAAIPNIAENKRNRKKLKPGPKRFFDKSRYDHRFCIERTFAWVDKFKRLLIRFECKDIHFKGRHFIAFTLINLRHVVDSKV